MSSVILLYNPDAVFDPKNLMTLSKGTQLGPYEILAPIGAGGMGEVYLAHDSRLTRDVAIKVAAEHFTERFEREARAVAALNHPNICTLHDVGPNYLVMEYVEGESPKGPMPLDEALRIAKQIAEALAVAHEKGIVHRDLKPANIKVRPDGTVKVLDFGLAKVGGAAPVSNENSPTISMAATNAGIILGTAEYMSPEQARGKPVDKRADIWAFGVVLYELITGERPFHGDDLGDLLAAVIKEQPSYEKITHEVRRLIRKCLEKDSAKRLRDIGDVWELLDPPVGAQGESRSPANAKRSMGPWIAATVFGLALAAVSALHFREPDLPVPATLRFSIPMPPKTTFGNNLAISPDGRQVVFRALTDGIARLWVHALDSLESRMLPGTEGIVNAPFWSYDGHTIVFGVSGQLKKISTSGGPPTTLCVTPGNLTGGFWTADDRIVFGTSRSTLLQVPAGGGTPVSITNLGKEENSHQMPALLPDGKHYLYLRRAANADISGISLRSLDAKPDDPDIKSLLRANSSVYFTSPPGAPPGTGHLIFTRENVLMAQPFNVTRLELAGDPVPITQGVTGFGAFYASGNGVLAYGTGDGEDRELTWFDRKGQRLEAVWKPGQFSELEISPDGSKVAAVRSGSNSQPDVWVYEFAGNRETQITSDPSGDSHPVWSPDSQKLVYYSNRGGALQFFTRSGSGAGPEALLAKFDGTQTTYPQSWSRDGHLIYERGSIKTGRDLMGLPIENGTAGKPSAYLNSDANEAAGQFSPDGRYVAYVLNRAERSDVYVSTFPDPNAGRWTISSGGGFQPRWNRNGKELLFFTGEGKLMSVDVALSPAFKALVPKELFTAPIYGGGANNGQIRWDISTDGQKFLINTSTGETSVPLTVVVNWQPK